MEPGQGAEASQPAAVAGAELESSGEAAAETVSEPPRDAGTSVADAQPVDAQETRQNQRATADREVETGAAARDEASAPEDRGASPGAARREVTEEEAREILGALDELSDVPVMGESMVGATVVGPIGLRATLTQLHSSGPDEARLRRLLRRVVSTVDDCAPSEDDKRRALDGHVFRVVFEVEADGRLGSVRVEDLADFDACVVRAVARQRLPDAGLGEVRATLTISLVP